MSLQSAIETVEEADLAVAEQAAEVRHHPVTRALGHLSDVADQPPMLTLGMLVLAGGLITGQWRVAEAGGRLLASVALATAIKTVVKRVVVRTRPHVLADEGRYETGLLGATDGPHSSFPSGHTADAVAAARAVVRVYPEAQLPLHGAAAAIGAVQIPRCAHYPSDITAGALVGLAAEAIVDQVWSRWGEARATNNSQGSGGLTQPQLRAPTSRPPRLPRERYGVGGWAAVAMREGARRLSSGGGRDRP